MSSKKKPPKTEGKNHSIITMFTQQSLRQQNSKSSCTVASSCSKSTESTQNATDLTTSHYFGQASSSKPQRVITSPVKVQEVKYSKLSLKRKLSLQKAKSDDIDAKRNLISQDCVLQDKSPSIKKFKTDSFSKVSATMAAISCPSLPGYSYNKVTDSVGDSAVFNDVIIETPTSVSVDISRQNKLSLSKNSSITRTMKHERLLEQKSDSSLKSSDPSECSVPLIQNVQEDSTQDIDCEVSTVETGPKGNKSITDNEKGAELLDGIGTSGNKVENGQDSTETNAGANDSEEDPYRVPYYLENFQLIVKTVVEDEFFQELFNEEDHKTIEAFHSASGK